MAALPLQTARTLLPAFNVPFARPLFAAAATSLSAALFPRAAAGWTLPTAWQSILELLPPFLLAVPKKKTSHSRKAMRSANKGLKDKQNLVHCPGCGSPKLAHHLCPSCYSSINRGWKAKAKSDGGAYREVPTVSLD